MGTHTVSVGDHVSGVGQTETYAIYWQCSATCMYGTLDRVAPEAVTARSAGTAVAQDADSDEAYTVQWGAYPCGDETDTCEYCSGCGTRLWHGLECPAWETGDDDDCPRPATVEPELVF